ncbi:MAG: transcription antitermination factor NusB [Bacteroidales bacterium]|nr:transcription antitermination factor NusB [Bacteroidales bacterium]
MLSRHFLRCKVLQELYSCQLGEKSEAEAIHSFDYHVQHLNELGVLQVALMVKMLEVGEAVIEAGKKKFRPTAEEKSPNRKFLGNGFLLRMADNYELKKLVDEHGGCWQTHEDLVREAFIEFRRQDVYCQYLSHPERSFQEDKEVAIALFRFLMNREALVEAMGGRSLLWEDDFEQIAQYNFMMLKTLEEETLNEAMPWPVMYDVRLEKDRADMEFARELLRDTFAGRQECNELIKSRLQGWEFERVAMIDVLLIDMALTELMHCPSIPERVTVDEYIELAKEFSSERSHLFVNGILEKLLLELRSQGKVKKSGRGLLGAGGEEVQA